ncbi:MAG: hypothetical protein VX265_15030 [Myxococcota bacterium]|nr:hypothetical protein [Myxococcota bacterium]
MPIQALVRPLPPGDPRSWLARAALSRTEDAPPHVVLAGTADSCLAAGISDADPTPIASIDGALMAEPDVQWVGGHGVAVVQRDGRPILASYARLRFRDGSWWCRTWVRLPGVQPDPAGGEDHSGLGGPPPISLRLLLPRAVAGETVVRMREPRSPGPLPAPDFTLTLPDGATFPDAVQAAAHRLEAHFVNSGRGRPALVAWTTAGIQAWLGEGRAAAGRLHAWGRMLSAENDIRALGLFGLGEDERGGRRVPMVALAMQRRGSGSVLWLRRFERRDDGRARWVDPVGLIRTPGPPLSMFPEDD